MRYLAAFAFVLLGFLAPGFAQDTKYDRLFQSFSAHDLTYNERRYLQAALAFEGHYHGLLDGDWGRLSREAMARYSRKEFNSVSREWHMAMLAFQFFEQYATEGWEIQFLPGLEMSLMLPQKSLVTDPRSEHFLNYRHANSSLAFSFGVLNLETANNIHDFTLRSHARRSEPYSVRKRNFAVSSATQADGSRLYTRSNFINGVWSTIMVSSNAKDKNLLGAVTSSISAGRSQRFDIEGNGKLMSIITQTAALLDDANKADQTPNNQPNQSLPEVSGQDRPIRTSGSGFYVSEAGHVLTNAHVIAGCRTIWVDDKLANVLDASDEFDLALLEVPSAKPKAVAVFSARPARLNSDVTAVGFPYADLLGGLNVTRGSVSALKGFRGDANNMQITAPVQSGNSGGPLVASDGEVIGVVVSKLDAIKFAERGGDLPQNVNFAIRGEIAQLFLAQNQLAPKLSLDDVPIAPEVLAERAANFTTFIECNK